MFRVFVSDKLEAVAIAVLREAGLEVDERRGLAGEALQQAMCAADGMIVRSSTKVTAELLEAPGRLKAVVRAGVGVDTIDVAAATRQGIVVMNTPLGNTTSAAEHTFALLLALARHLRNADASTRETAAFDPAVRQIRWNHERTRLMGVQLAQKTLGIIGLGNVGRQVARRAQAFDMRVVGLDPMLDAARAEQLGVVRADSLEQLLPQCQFLTVHTPADVSTLGLIGERELALLPRGARVVNTARGGIIDERALAEALQSGHIAGAAVDVFTVEPPTTDHPLLHAPNVLLTPHVGASTLEAQELVAREAAQLLVEFLLHGKAGPSVVNREVLHGDGPPLPDPAAKR